MPEGATGSRLPRSDGVTLRKDAYVRSAASFKKGRQALRPVVYDPGEIMQHTAPIAASPIAPARAGRFGRLRELALASALGAAVVIWPGDGALSQAPWQTPPPFVRALGKRELVKLRLSPWLLIEALHSSDRE